MLEDRISEWANGVRLDVDWLRGTGYPALRDCALFYTDFLKKREDGRYHAFPSNDGEAGFSGNPQDYTDRAQVLQHARYCLRAAIMASEVLNEDPALRAEWQDRLDHCAGDAGQPPLKLTGIVSSEGSAIETAPDAHQRVSFPTESGKRYALTPAG